MAGITIVFDNSINSSLQIGDEVYYCPNLFHGGFNTVDNANLSSTGIVHIGKCDSIDRLINKISILVNPSLSGPQATAVTGGIGVGDFIMFSKDNKANLNSLLGYYAETTFINDSPHKAELFAASTEVSESSK